MKITTQVRQEDLDAYICHLQKQQANYGSRAQEHGVVCMMGDKFNIYIYPHGQALLPTTMRLIAIEPKDTPM